MTTFLLLLSLTFSEHSVKQQAKVFQGRPATQDAYPGVLKLNDKANDFVGTVIAVNQCIIGAAHLIKAHYSTNVTITNLEGKFTTTIEKEKLEIPEAFMTENYLTKPHRTFSEYASDIVVAKLKAKPPLSYNSNILDESICKKFKADLEQNKSVSATIAGYGTTELSHSLIRGVNYGFNDGQVKIVGYHDGAALKMLPDPQLPAGGDSGGPVFIEDDKKNKKLVGITTSMNRESIDASSADVCKNLDWIKKQLKNFGCE